MIYRFLTNRGGENVILSIASVAILVIALSSALVACSKGDDAVCPDTNPATRSLSPADSLVHYGGVDIDTTWAGEIHMSY